jgi:hypothetical protein
MIFDTLHVVGSEKSGDMAIIAPGENTHSLKGSFCAQEMEGPENLVLSPGVPRVPLEAMNKYQTVTGLADETCWQLSTHSTVAPGGSISTVKPVGATGGGSSMGRVSVER